MSTLRDLALRYGVKPVAGVSKEQVAGKTLHALCLQLCQDTLEYPSFVDAQSISDLKSLLDAGVDINFFDDGHRTALWWVVMANHFTAARLLLEAGASREYEDINGCTFYEHLEYFHDEEMISQELYSLLRQT